MDSRIKRVRELLLNHNNILALIRILETEIAANDLLKESAEETIAGMYYARVSDGMPGSPGKISDKTMHTATGYAEENSRINEEPEMVGRALERQKVALELEAKRVDDALSVLTEYERDVVELSFFSRKDLFDISDFLEAKYTTDRRNGGRSTKQCSRIRKRALEKMAKVLGWD